MHLSVDLCCELFIILTSLSPATHTVAVTPTELSVRASVTSMARRSLSRSDPAIARAHELGLLQDLLRSFHYGTRQVPGVSDEDSSGPGNSRALEEVSLTKYRNYVVRYSCDSEGKVTSPAPEVRQHRPLRRTRSWEYVYIPSLPYFHEVSMLSMLIYHVGHFTDFASLSRRSVCQCVCVFVLPLPYRSQLFAENGQILRCVITDSRDLCSCTDCHKP